ncbi:YncE family protein [Dactylosporangium matsuzakiense]|uniref:Lipoprotein n=1 Tax=Dactylosporangium matsuzakiense TaxID=53360 RepID=A0A9W6NK05_9ACTN|nr:hypothetical protein [Dactylosporangium matsuzakiense]UWZ42179.1 hypothetical protein Dmats_31940 [Dactylosporangium matsuzakiense]GLK99818.1 lipoprotein [Dactylosporangium matsuzakiense]
MLRRLIPLAGLLLLTACDVGAPVDHPDATVPTPTWAPAPSVVPTGAAVVPQRVTGLAFGTDIAVMTANSAFVLPAGATAPTKPAVPGPAKSVLALPGGGFRAVVGSTLVELPGGAVTTLPAEGGAIAAPPGGDWIAVALPGRGDVIMLSPAGNVLRTIHTGGRPSALAADAERIAVVDAAESSLTTFDAATGARQEALRAGDGAVTVAAVGAGRFAVVDARDGELLVFDAGPLILRQRYPVKGGAWAAAFDPGRGVLWVTLTARNEVVGLHLGGGSPREVGRHATVQLPIALAVDAATGALAVAGSGATAGQGLVQRIVA